MPADYRYDVFISYRHSDAVHGWVHNHLKGELRAWLAESMPRDPEIFIDDQIRVGSVWPDALAEALLRSRCMVCVWSPSYFRSAWCQAELATMRARLESLRAAGVSPLPRLIYALRFHDGEYFDAEAKKTQWRDMADFADPRPAFRHTERYGRFMDEIKAMATDLSAIIADAPPWDGGWPVIRPPTAPTPNPPLPRLS